MSTELSGTVIVFRFGVNERGNKSRDFVFQKRNCGTRARYDLDWRVNSALWSFLPKFRVLFFGGTGCALESITRRDPGASTRGQRV